MINKVILIINTGTPDKPEVSDVRRFLSEFLNDKRVIDLPWLFRKILVNLIIVPFRAPKSTVLYKKLWTDKGSPLLRNLNSLTDKIQKRVNNETKVFGAMRYGNPSLCEILDVLEKNPPGQLIVFPLYPHYASSTTGSVNEFIMNKIKGWSIMPQIKFTGQFYSNPEYLAAMVSQIRKYDPDKFDHILFSYHGLPLNHIQSIHPESDCSTCNCTDTFPENGTFCYKATCYETTRLLSSKLNLSHEKISTSFQSRLTKNWLSPFTDETLRNLALIGKKKVLVIAPSFVADCLETTIEIKEEYSKVFLSEGGEDFVFVDSLNDNDDWAEALIRIAEI